VRKLLLSWIVAMVISAFAMPATAQSGKGSVSGRVVDSGGGVLQGAEVELQPLGIKAATNNQGEFTFTDLAPGAFTVSVNFVGFAPSRVDVTVTAGATSRADATLQVAGASEQVIVTADRVHGEAEAINRTRTAENILQVLPAEVITSLPNANVADAIGRLPSVTLERDEGEGKYVQIRGAEPRYSNVTIDGVNIPSPESGVRQIKLDIIPSDLVEAVEINKTLLANMDGDAIGGSVNMRTKTAGEQPTISLFGLGGYTPIEKGRDVTNFGGTIGKRFGKDKRLGVLFGGAYDWNGRGINDVEPSLNTIQCDPGNCGNPSANAPYYGTYSGASLREYRYYRVRFGFEGSVDYKINDNSFLYVRGLYSHFDNFGDVWEYSPKINSYTTSPFQGGTDGTMSMYDEIRRPVEQIGSVVAGGRHVWATSTISWELSASRSGAADHGYSNANFGPIDPSIGPNAPLNNVQFNVDLSNPYRPRFPVQNGVNIYDPTQYFWLGQQGFDVSTGRSAHVNLQGAVDYGKSYSWNGHFGTFAMGVKVRNGHKYEEANDQIYGANDPTSLPMSLFPTNQADPGFYGGSYSLGPFPNFNAIRSYFRANPSAFTLDTNATHTSNDPANFDLIERVVAGYFMNSISFGKFRLYAGLRFEGTTEDALGRQVLFDSNGNYVSTSAVSKNGGYVDPLPSVELSYAVTPDSRLRLAYGRGIARPNFGDLAPYLQLSPVPGGISTSSEGNPNLKATHANNYDVLFEQYLKPLGMIQAGFFYKDISDPIYTVQTDNVQYPGFTELFRQTQPINGSSAWLWGFEIAYQQRLSYLPGPLAALGISANYSYTASRASFTPNIAPLRTDHPALQRQAPHTWNISPTYDRGRVSIRVGLTYNSANIFGYNYTDGAPLGIKGPNGDNYLYAHLQIDAQGTVRLPKGFSAVAYGLNLNNEVFGFYNGSPIWVVQREYYKPTYGVGIRWNSGPEK
jgi:TonB-dependent receptor